MRPQPSFEQFLLKKAERNLTRAKRGEETRACVSVAMSRRYRGDSVSDRFGKFSPSGTLRWLDDRISEAAADALATLHFLPVVEPAVSANLAAMCTAKVRLSNEAAGKLPQAAGIAGVAEGVARLLDGHEDHWSENLESRVALLAQIGFGYFIRSRHNPRKRGEKTKQIDWGEEMLPRPGKYACGSCTSGGPFLGEVTPDPGGSGMLVTACPECNEVAEVLEEPGEEPMTVPTGERMENCGDSETSVHPDTEFRIDEGRTQGGNLRAARWFERHYLMTLDEIEQENPGFDPGAPEEWSFTLKWQYALESGTDEHVENFDPECDTFEVRDICLLPDDYASYVVPAGGGFVLRNTAGQPVIGAEGEPVFQIGEGERLIERFPDGFRYRLCGTKLMPGTPEDAGIKEYDFRSEWAYGGFRPDPHSFWMRPLTAVLNLQDDITTLYTIDISHRERFSRRNVVYDDFAFDPEAWDYDEVRTKEGFSLENGDDIRHHVHVLEEPQLRQAMEGLQFLFSIAPQVGSPPPAASGAPDPTEDTYRGQLLKRQAALGILAPSQQSKAQAKVQWFKQQLKLAQSWPEDRFAYLKSRFGEEWREQDIEAFKEADLDKVLIVSYVEGSEVPTTLVEREQKMGAFLMQLFEAIPALQQAGEFGPDLRHLISQYADLAGIDYDIGDAEADERLAQARYDIIREALPEAVSPEDVFVMMEHPVLHPLRFENHASHIEFWQDRARALLCEEKPNLPLVALCEEMVTRHEQGGVTDAQTQGENQRAAEAPAREAMAEEQAAGVAAEGDKMVAEQGAQDEARAHEAEEKERARAHQTEMKERELASRETVAAMQAQSRQQQPRVGA